MWGARKTLNKCKHCGHSWDARQAHASQCPNCGSTDFIRVGERLAWAVVAVVILSLLASKGRYLNDSAGFQAATSPQAASAPLDDLPLPMAVVAAPPKRATSDAQASTASAALADTPAPDSTAADSANADGTATHAGPSQVCAAAGSAAEQSDCLAQQCAKPDNKGLPECADKAHDSAQ